MCHLTPGIGEPRPIDSQLLLPSNRLALPEEDAGPVHDGAEHIEVIALISRSIERYSFPVGNRWPGSVIRTPGDLFRLAWSYSGPAS